jgi:hypothetical protein
LYQFPAHKAVLIGRILVQVRLDPGKRSGRRRDEVIVPEEPRATPTYKLKARRERSRAVLDGITKPS